MWQTAGTRALTCEGAHRDAEVRLWVLAELAVAAVRLVAGDHVVACDTAIVGSAADICALILLLPAWPARDSPGCTDVTPSPTLSTTPAASCPRMQGNNPAAYANHSQMFLVVCLCGRA